MAKQTPAFLMGLQKSLPRSLDAFCPWKRDFYCEKSQLFVPSFLDSHITKQPLLLNYTEQGQVNQKRQKQEICFHGKNAADSFNGCLH